MTSEETVMYTILQKLGRNRKSVAQKQHKK